MFFDIATGRQAVMIVGQFANLNLRIKTQWNQAVIKSGSNNTRQTRMNIGLSRVMLFS
jgi:hypothetical protein